MSVPQRTIEAVRVGACLLGAVAIAGSTSVLGGAGLVGPALAGVVTPVAATPVIVPVALSALNDQSIGSTVAPNGDTHPYSLAIVPSGYSGTPLADGDVLVGDLSNVAGVTGTGRSIMRFHLGAPSLFSTAVTGPDGLAFNESGSQLWVSAFGIADNGTHGEIGVVRTEDTKTTHAGGVISGGGIGDSHGPWGIAADHSSSAPAFFWSNADGGITRDAKLTSPYNSSSSTKNTHTTLATLSHGAVTSIAGGTIVAPQGMVYDSGTDTLFVADSASDQIVAIRDATTSSHPTVTQIAVGGPLHTPRALALDHNTDDLLVTNGAVDNELVELTESGTVVGTRDLDPTGPAGGISGLATTRDASGQTEIYYVDDDTNTLHLLSATATGVTLNGATSITARYGTPLTISGVAPAGSTVAVFFHRANVAGYVQGRTLQASGSGTFSTSFAPNDDYVYYAQVGVKTSTPVLEVTTPSISGTTTVKARRGHTLVLSGHGAPHSSVLLHFHKQGTSATNFSLVRSVHVNAEGVWTKPIVMSVDYRVYASRGVLHPYSPRYLLLAD